MFCAKNSAQDSQHETKFLTVYKRILGERLLKPPKTFVQRKAKQPLYQEFKHFLQLGQTEPGQLHFILTGSGMVKAWIDFRKMPANGAHFPSVVGQVDLETRSSRAALDYTERCLVLERTSSAAERDDLE
eukprot:3128554-Amphidinium_carterae.2